MKKLIFGLTIAVSLFLFYSPASAQTYTTGELYQLAITPPPGGNFELPFNVVIHENQRILNIPTGWTYNCLTTANPLTQIINFQSNQCQLTQKSYVHQNDTAQPPWFRNYAGTFTNHLITVNDQLRLYSLNHGENKNELVSGQLYQNTVNPNIAAASCYSGVQNGTYQDCNRAYNSFVTLSYSPVTNTNNLGTNYPQTDLGPITWPVAGYYHPNNDDLHAFIRIPHGIVHNNYFYVFYHETQLNYGIKVIRAPLDNLNPSGFTKYCNGQWLPALPIGFNKSSLAGFYRQPSPCASSIINQPPGSDQISFAAAQAGPNLFFGIEEIAHPGKWEINLYQSFDLTNWTFIKTLRQTESYATGDLHYPLFLNSEATSNEQITPDNFLPYRQ